MNLDLSVASLVRASSGVLMAAFGLYLLTVRPATLRSRALGTYHLALGPVFVLTNLFSLDAAALSLTYRISTIPWLVTAGASIVLAWHETRSDRRARSAFSIAFGILLAGNLAVALLVPTQIGDLWVALTGAPPEAGARLNDSYDDGRFFYSPLYSAPPALVLAFAFLFRATPDPLDRRRLALLTTGLALYPVFDQASSAILESSATAHSLIAMSAFALGVIAWALVARGPASGAARNVSLAIAVAGIVGLWTAAGGDDLGLLGASRLAGLAILAYAVFHLDLLQTGFKARTIRRGTLATGGLAALFIVAQVAQEFFAAEYGLLMGGMAAGALLFAARPIERAVASASSRSLTVPAGSMEPDERARNAYRRAVRLALEDGALTPTEELALAGIADDLGISAAEAIRLRLEMQAEASQGRR